MRVISMLLAATVFAVAQSHPSWWTLAPPDATALVGIHWETLGESTFAEPVAAALGSEGLGFPDLDCLKHASQILISSPELLAIATGHFAPPILRVEALGAGMKAVTYNTVPLWISPAKRTLSVAQLNEQLILIGSRKTLEAAIDREAAETRRYSPLLARAAHYGQTKDLWVVASQLPDPLASLFIPLEVQSGPVEGSLSIRNGLQVDASLDAGSAEAAGKVAETLQASVPTLPAVARGLQVRVDGQQVLLALNLTREQVMSGLRQAPAAPHVPVPVPAPLAIPVEAPVQQQGPQIIHIFGLDDGPREIVLPPAANRRP